MFGKVKVGAIGIALTAVALPMSGSGLAQGPEAGARPWNPELGFEIAEQGNQAIRTIREEARHLPMPALPDASEVMAAEPDNDGVSVASGPEDNRKLRLAH